MPCTTCKVKVSYTCRSDDTNQASFTLLLTNNGSMGIPLPDLTVRYWYKADATTTQKAECDYAMLGCTNVTLTIKPVTPPKAKATAYVELAFGTGSGMLDGFSTSGEVQVRLHNDPYSTFDQTDDYSFDCSMKGMAVAASNITAYVKGTLVWGTEPQ